MLTNYLDLAEVGGEARPALLDEMLQIGPAPIGSSWGLPVTTVGSARSKPPLPKIANWKAKEIERLQRAMAEMRRKQSFPLPQSIFHRQQRENLTRKPPIASIVDCTTLSAP
jgi:hypothetical protein